jgi:hypothetical protein
MDEGVLSFNKIVVDQNFLDEVWKFSPNTLDSLSTEAVSKYSLALAQYLIYFKAEQNKAKAKLVKKKRFYESSILMCLSTSKIPKEYKTKAEKTEYLVNTTAELSKVTEEISNLDEELIRIEGIDKAISEYIATFKRELGRREQELFTTRRERR